MAPDLSRIFDVVERWVTEAPDRDALAFGIRAGGGLSLTAGSRAAGALRVSGLGRYRLVVLDKNHPACLERARSSGRSKVLAYGGSPMPAPLMERMPNVSPAPLYSACGRTETWRALRPGARRAPRSAPRPFARLGQPTKPGNEVRVVDRETGTDLRPGEVGEFWVRSE